MIVANISICFRPLPPLFSSYLFTVSAPAAQVILLSDGSVTRHLQLMTGLSVGVECLEMRRLQEAELPGLPAATSLLEGPLLQRQVLLHLPEPLNRPFVYAASWWNAETVEEYLK
jgi:chorismate--pyruvate lyase